jgi:hypothetical protein
MMRCFLSLATACCLLSAVFAQTLPIGFSDLTPAKQAELMAAWKKNYRSEISAVPPGQTPTETPAVKPVEVPTPLVPKAVGGESYADIKAKVDKGETVYMAVIPDGYIRLDPADAKEYGLQPGLWKCWKENGKNYMVLVTSAPSKPQPAYVQRWTHPPDLRAHLMSELHGFSAETLKNMSLDDMKRLHDEDHDRKGGVKPPAPQRQPILPYAPVPNLQNIFRPGGVGGLFQPNCPTGNT